MDHLKEEFHEDLADESSLYIEGGRVFIREKHLAPEEILKLMSDEAYSNTFNDWFEERKERALDTAFSILKKFDNQARFQKLKICFDSGTVVPFVGSGLSIPSGFPGWENYLLELTNETHLERIQITNLISQGKYEEAAQVLFDEMGSTLFNEHLQNRFCNKQKLEIDGVFGPVNFLPKLFPKAVITTNFDQVIETVYKNQGISLDIHYGNASPEFPRLYAQGNKVILKLHGHGEVARTRILTQEEYQQAYADSRILRNIVSSVLFGKTLLFLGCSLNADRTISLMKDYVTEFGNENIPQHYAFLNLRTEDDRIARRRQLAEANIFPIWYEGETHNESIESLLIALAKGNVAL